ncbi:uncharacterized protein MKK02DRAFT_41438 [Dioszegia hungarica]|uniref:Uncharacterized protein n=1 Tax=Dioszegia hungarica TaxID=4972 RepID=A0AA38H3Z3_9TREE|nr:uncharacterized protein MKK02DRAFT_41438 [Dioszegia hungarica]KAI9631809.1 hypothetical protein MKK02DRAFT_41438 [Dioszegia hungarica]
MRSTFLLAFLGLLSAVLASPLPLSASTSLEAADTSSKSYNTYFHIGEAGSGAGAGVSETVLDLEAVEAAKEAIKDKLDSGAQEEEEKVKSRVMKFRGGISRGGAGAHP